MPNPGVQLEPNARNDLRGSDADSDGTTAAQMIDALVVVIIDLRGRLRKRQANDHFADLYRRDLRTLAAIREVIVEIAPGLCAACGEFVPVWLFGDGTKIPCPSCGARHLTQSHSAGSPDHPSGAATAEADVVSSPPATSAPFIPMPAEASDAMLEASWNSVRNVPASERMACEFKTGREAHFHKQRHRYKAMVAVVQSDTAPPSGAVLSGSGA